MEENNRQKSSPIFAAIIIVAALILMIALFMLSGKDRSAPITLPENIPGHTMQSENPQSAEENFIEVTADNVQQVVKTLSRPLSYHQIYNVTHAEGERKSVQLVDIWTNGSLLRADTTASTGVSSVITNGEKACLWYSDGNEPVEILLNDTISTDDMLGLPTYELLLDEDPATIVEAGYLVMQDTNLRCIYVSVSVTDATTREYWIDIDTGLLYQAGITVGDQVVYSAEQKDLDILPAEDEAFLDQFILPDGSVPFSAE